MTRGLFVLMLLLTLPALALGCEGKERATATSPDAGIPVDTEVMAFLSEARALHHEANIKEDSGDLEGATQTMQRLVVAQRPHPLERIPEIDEVLADAAARLAELRMRGHDLDGALRAIDDGLRHAPGPTYFRGHLLEVEGIVEEARAAVFASASKSDESAKARAHALTLLQEAVRVQEQVILQALPADGGSK